MRSRVMFSIAKVENVVKPPHKPVASASLHTGSKKLFFRQCHKLFLLINNPPHLLPMFPAEKWKEKFFAKKLAPGILMRRQYHFRQKQSVQLSCKYCFINFHQMYIEYLPAIYSRLKPLLIYVQFYLPNFYNK